MPVIKIFIIFSAQIHLVLITQWQNCDSSTTYWRW